MLVRMLDMAKREAVGVDSTWVVGMIEQIAQFGKGKTGITRLAFSEADKLARNFVIEMMSTIGLNVRVDAAGNIIGRLEGSKCQTPVVMTGSHLDTVPEGGKFDGVLGVVSALAAVQRLKQRGALSHPLEVVVFAAEESSRFGVATFGSKAMTGLLTAHTWSRAKDREGVSLRESVAGFGLEMETVKAAVRPQKDMKAFVELHIEQGRMLEHNKISIGIADSIAAPTRCKITVEGVAAHSGTTPMDERQDALVSAAMIILSIQEIALAQSHYGTVATVGNLRVQPGVINVIPGLAELWVDIRGIEHESIVDALQEIKDAISAIADAQDTPVAIEVISSEKPVSMNEEVSNIIESVCKKKNVSYQRLYSGAGHDAMSMAHSIPSGLILIPCKDGISHNPDEAVAEADIASGIEVLTETLYQLAK